jgi:hypothetical protein
MTGDSPEALSEGRDVAQRLLQNDALRRLAENPLLLTMLLVVKHGAGRLPPDRVSLYDRAVDVLLDTWNIKGHDALNVKETVPQLACVAFQLMRDGRQTATEKELLALLEEAREKVPQIRRYAKDTPYEFLKRVELRSSLIIEAGHQLEGGHTVPFYQFRHLTFQEFLAAVAAVEGHYMEYQKGDTVLTPLESHLTAEKWKEVIPMAAVLARKQAEPLMAALVTRGNELRAKMEKREGIAELSFGKIPSAVARLVQCLAEEAEASPEVLTAALQIIALFAAGGRSSENWEALIRGPYGEELLHQAWLLYAPMQLRKEYYLVYTLASIAVRRQPRTYWDSNEGQVELMRLLHSQSSEEITCGLLIVSELVLFGWSAVPGLVERYLFQEDPALWNAATLAWGRIHFHQASREPAPEVLDRLLSLWLIEASKKDHPSFDSIASFALSTQYGLPRKIWAPELTVAQKQFVRQAADKSARHAGHEYTGALMVAFHARDVWPEEELARRLDACRQNPVFILPPNKNATAIDAMLEQMGEAGQKYLRASVDQRQKRK